MSKKSFRVELEAELYFKLGQIAQKHNQSMTEWIREKISSSTEIELQDLTTFTEKYHRIYRQLQYWTAKRLNCGYNNRNSDVHKEVTEIINNIVLTDCICDLRLYTQIYDRRLSRQEKTLIASFFPFCINTRFELINIDWFKKLNWYQTEEGEYIVLKEPVLDEIFYKGEVVGTITKNRYHANVLNCADMCIIDVDIASDRLESCGTPYRKVALTALAAYQEENPQYSFRVYRTKAGLRYICTNERISPASIQSNTMMQKLFADPLYQKLCNFQDLYRARLSPKPWRYYEDDILDTRVCELIQIVGDGLIIEPFKKCIEYHDRETKALEKNTNLFLA